MKSLKDLCEEAKRHCREFVVGASLATVLAGCSSTIPLVCSDNLYRERGDEFLQYDLLTYYAVLVKGNLTDLNYLEFLEAVDQADGEDNNVITREGLSVAMSRILYSP